MVATLEPILEKMRRKHLQINEFKDILGMRIEVNNIQDIYNTVKKLEQLYGNKIIMKEDYIANPKGIYVAYHMNVEYGPGIYSEIQIRTPLMDRIDNASHAILYKNNVELDVETRQDIERVLNTYSAISLSKATPKDLKMIPKTKEILRRFGL